MIKVIEDKREITRILLQMNKYDSYHLKPFIYFHDEKNDKYFRVHYVGILEDSVMVEHINYDSPDDKPIFGLSMQFAVDFVHEIGELAFKEVVTESIKLIEII